MKRWLVLIIFVISFFVGTPPAVRAQDSAELVDPTSLNGKKVRLTYFEKGDNISEVGLVVLTDSQDEDPTAVTTQFKTLQYRSAFTNSFGITELRWGTEFINKSEVFEDALYEGTWFSTDGYAEIREIFPLTPKDNSIALRFKQELWKLEAENRYINDESPAAMCLSLMRSANIIVGSFNAYEQLHLLCKNTYPEPFDVRINSSSKPRETFILSPAGNPDVTIIVWSGYPGGMISDSISANDLPVLVAPGVQATFLVHVQKEEYELHLLHTYNGETSSVRFLRKDILEFQSEKVTWNFYVDTNGASQATPTPTPTATAIHTMTPTVTLTLAPSPTKTSVPATTKMPVVVSGGKPKPPLSKAIAPILSSLKELGLAVLAFIALAAILTLYWIRRGKSYAGK